jgi:16S rRNA processing protein RimM
LSGGRRDWLSAGRVGRPHGLDGSFHVTRPRPTLLEEGVAVTVGDRLAEVVRRAGTDARPIIRLDVASDREGAERLRGEDLRVSRAAAPALGADEWWAEDLEGCTVVDGELEIGVVRRLLELPSCEVLEVERREGGELLVPLVRDAIRRVDVEARRIDVDTSFLGAEEADETVADDEGAQR